MHPSPHRPDRKTLQLCAQVERALGLALAGLGDDSLLGAYVSSVRPAPDDAQLCVEIGFAAGPRLPRGLEALAALERAKGRLRAEVAAAICRKRAPDLLFTLAPLADGPPVAAALIFDIDGTLVDTEPANAAASVRVFRELAGIEVRPEDFRPFVGTGDRRYLEGVADRYGAAIDLDRATELRERYIREVAEAQGLRAFPGMRELIAAARARPEVRLAIATSGTREKSRMLLAAAGIDPATFAAYVTKEDVAHPKPAPDLYIEAAARLGVPPARCVVIEDAPAGVEAALRAGMKCVALTQSSPPDTLTRAHRTAGRIDEIGLDGLVELAGMGR